MARSKRKPKKTKTVDDLRTFTVEISDATGAYMRFSVTPEEAGAVIRTLMESNRSKGIHMESPWEHLS